MQQGCPKKGQRPSHKHNFNLAITLATLSAIEAIPGDCLQETLAIGALSLDGRLNAVTGALPAALHAAENGLSLLCPQVCGAEAAWVETTPVISADTLGRLIQHLNGQAVISPAAPGLVFLQNSTTDFANIKGQERANAPWKSLQPGVIIPFRLERPVRGNQCWQPG